MGDSRLAGITNLNRSSLLGGPIFYAARNPLAQTSPSRTFARHLSSSETNLSIENCKRSRPQSTVSQGGRIPSLDLLKLIAVSAVVGLHAPDSITHVSVGWQISNQIFRFAVPSFFIISGFLFKRSFDRSSDKLTVLLRYGTRILVPFLFWSIFYALVPPFVSGAPNGIPSAIRDHFTSIVRFPHAFLLTGFVYHLWFLSALGQGLFVLWLSMRVSGVKLVLILGAALYCIALCAEPYSPSPIGLHWHFYARNGPFFSTLFVGLGAWLADTGLACKTSSALWLLCLGLLMQLTEVYFLYFLYRTPIRDHNFVLGTVPYALGCVLLALSKPNIGRPCDLSNLGLLTLGIYAFHPYVIEVLLPLAHHSNLLMVPILFESTVLIISVGVVWCVSKFPLVGHVVS